MDNNWNSLPIYGCIVVLLLQALRDDMHWIHWSVFADQTIWMDDWEFPE